MTFHDDDLPWPDDAVEVARVIGAWGIKGGIRVQTFAKDPQAIFSTKRWFVLPAEPRGGAVPSVVTPKAASPALPKVLHIASAKIHGDDIVAMVKNVVDRNAAEALKGVRIFVSRASFPTASTDEYYWVDLIGLEVVNRDGERLGVVTELLDTGAHSVLKIDDDGHGAEPGKPIERLIPFVSAYIDSVDLPTRRIVADWGLDY